VSLAVPYRDRTSEIRVARSSSSSELIKPSTHTRHRKKRKRKSDEGSMAVKTIGIRSYGIVPHKRQGSISPSHVKPRKEESSSGPGMISMISRCFPKRNKSEQASMCLRRGFVSTNDCGAGEYKEAATTKECPFSVDKATAMLLVLCPFLYPSHPSYLPSLPSLRHSFVFRSSSL
jgi:hypothetical protein